MKVVICSEGHSSNVAEVAIPSVRRQGTPNKVLSDFQQQGCKRIRQFAQIPTLPVVITAVKH